MISTMQAELHDSQPRRDNLQTDVQHIAQLCVQVCKLGFALFFANMACKFCLTAARFRRFERQKLGLHICELGGKQLQACFLLQRLQT